MKSLLTEWGWAFASLRAMRKHLRMVLVTSLAVSVMGLIAWQFWPRTYHATFSIEILKQGQETQEEKASRAGKLRDLLFAPKGDVVQEYMALMRRHDVVRSALLRGGVIGPETPPKVTDLRVYQLRRGISVERDEGSPVLTVYVGAERPGDAEFLAENLLKALAEAARASRTYRLKEGLQELQKTRDATRQRMEGIRSVMRYFEDVDAVERRIDSLRTSIEAERRVLEKEISVREARKRALLDQYTADWHEVRAVDREIEYLQSFEEEAAPAAANVPETIREWRFRCRSYHERLDEALDEFDKALVEAWDQAGHQYENLAQLQDALDRQNERLAALGKDIDGYENSIAAESADLHKVIKEPVAPGQKSSPSDLNILVTVVLGAVLLSAVLVYLREVTDPTAKSLQELEQFSREDALALIPHLDGMLPTVEGFPLAYNTRGEALPPAEAFRTLKTNILFSIPKVASPVILITSSDREEGKSTTVLNLAFAFAEDHRTLALSCNMRRPTLHKALGVSEQRGMTDVLEGQLSWEEAVRRTRYPNLFFVPHGRIAQNSSVLLGRPAFARMIEEARAKYDVVLIDSPPATLLIDAAVIASKADATVLVYSLGETHKEQLKRALDVLRKVDARVVGLAANTKLPAAELGGRHYYYYQQEKGKGS